MNAKTAQQTQLLVRARFLYPGDWNVQECPCRLRIEPQQHPSKEPSVTVKRVLSRNALSRAVVLAVVVALIPLPVAADEPERAPKAAAVETAKAPEAPTIRAAIAKVDARDLKPTVPSRTTARRSEQQTSNPATDSPAFFKTGPGIAVLAVIAAGVGYALYSTQPRPGHFGGETVGGRLMRRLIHLISACLLAFGICSSQAWAQSQTGTVEGKVVDPQGGVLPGVTVTLSGPQGSQTTVTDAEGVFRFVGVQPATYVVKSELTGFLPKQVDTVLVGMGKTSNVDFTLQLSTFSENVDVRIEASQVDVKSAATETTLSSQLFELMPIYSPTSTGLLNNAPGINSSSAFGGTGHVWQRAAARRRRHARSGGRVGLDLLQPEPDSGYPDRRPRRPGGVRRLHGRDHQHDHQVRGNSYSGLFSMRYTNDSLAGDNISESMLEQNPTLGDAAVTKKLVDYTVQLGGPVKKDKAFFFGSVQRYSTKTDPAGPVTTGTDISPRFNLKFTLNPTTADTIILGTQDDAYNLTGRVGYWPVSQAGDNQTVTEDAPEWVWNAQWRRVFGTSAPAGDEVHRILGILLPRSGRPVDVHLRRRVGRVLGRRRRALLRGPQPESAPGVVHEVRGQVRSSLPEVWRRNRAKPCSEPVSALRTGRLLHLRVRRGSLLPRQLRVRRPGGQPADVRVRAGPVERRPSDAQHRPPPGSHSRIQPRARRDGVQALTWRGDPDSARRTT